MSATCTKISVKGRQVEVPLLQAEGFDLITTGRYLKTASVASEDYSDGNPALVHEKLIAALKAERPGPDIFTFAQRLPDVGLRHNYPVYWDNVAAIPLSTYAAWWEGLSQETRRNVRLAGKRGARVEPVDFDDDFVRGIVQIYNETPVRQGRKFWHFGKDHETVKRENSTYGDRSQFIAAYFGSELAGFIKLVYVGGYASIMQILSMEKHRDKKLTNALIAKAVELACQKPASHLLYCKYVYHKGHHDALAEFKRRNGFEHIRIPRYYVPLTLKGRIAVAMNLHLGITELLPRKLTVALLKARSFYYSNVRKTKSPEGGSLHRNAESA